MQQTIENTTSQWPSAAVAITMIALIGFLMGLSVYKGGMDGALKMWAALGTLVGILTGSMATYFFTRTTTSAALREASHATQLAVTASETAKTATQQVQEKDAKVQSQQQVITELQSDVLKKSQALESLSREHPDLRIRPEMFIVPEHLMDTRIHP